MELENSTTEKINSLKEEIQASTKEEFEELEKAREWARKEEVMIEAPVKERRRRSEDRGIAERVEGSDCEARGGF